MANPTTISIPAAPIETSPFGMPKRAYHVEIFLASFAALLLEISYTRVISFKLFYYYTYLVIGLALLGIGSGGVVVTISRRLRRAATERILAWSLLLGAAGVGVGYLVVARISLDTFAIWQYGTRTSLKNLLLLLFICVALAAPFVAVGVVLSTLFGRAPEHIGGLYFADLFGAGLACAVVVFLIASIGAPATVFLAGVVLAAGGVKVVAQAHSRLLPFAIVLAAILLGVLVRPSVLPEQHLEASKAPVFGPKFAYSSWSPIFRVDVTHPLPANLDTLLVFHDGLVGSAISRWDGNVATLSRYKFQNDIRVLPFSVNQEPPGREMIIGAAGGHEVLSSLYFNAGHIDAVELNPVTYSLVKGKFADFDGHLAQNPKVNYVKADGRSYLARSNMKYDLIWYPAPDSYSATNASTAGAFVLSESYLYTSNAIVDSLKHLSNGGVLAAQFGELNYNRKPNRTTRYVSTARQALDQLGIRDPTNHIIVATSPNPLGVGGSVLSTILVRAEPFTRAEVDRFVSALGGITNSDLRYAPGHADVANTVTKVITSTPAQLSAFYASYPYNVGPISDNSPFFWHFTPFATVLSHFTRSISPVNSLDREDTIGERVLILLFLVAVVLAAVFLLAPFITIRRTWAALPRKGRSAIYFAALGFGFIFFEITLIQRLILFLGYPTYSLTVTLMSLLIFAGIGALLSGRLKHRTSELMPVLAATIAALTAFYLFGLTPLTDALQALPLVARIPVAFAVLAPLGICLGMFMPLGLGAVAELTDHGREYVAWAWAVNGFATVIGSVLSTMLAMTFGFRVVLVLALIIYLIALTSLRGLVSARPATLTS
jgi:MFS family permease